MEAALHVRMGTGMSIGMRRAEASCNVRRRERFQEGGGGSAGFHDERARAPAVPRGRARCVHCALLTCPERDPPRITNTSSTSPCSAKICDAGGGKERTQKQRQTPIQSYVLLGESQGL